MTRFERQRRRLFLTILVLCILLTGLCTVAYAKYIYNEQKGGSVTITAQLGTITLQESKAVKAADGSYTLTGEKVSANACMALSSLIFQLDSIPFFTKSSLSKG